MADRIMLNETSYHGSGAIKEIANEAKARAFKKAFVCSDPDLIKFGVTAKVTDVLTEAGLATKSTPTSRPTPPSRTCSTAWKHLKQPVQTTL